MAGAWLVAAVMWPGQIGAEGGTGVAVSPAYQELEIPASDAGQDAVLTFTNHNDIDQNFRLSVADFGSLDEEGGVAFLGKPANELEHKYGLASWMQLEADALFVPAGQSRSVTVTVNNRKSLAPGGHYGAVLATAVDNLGRPLTSAVGVQPVLSSLLLVVKQGGGERDLTLVGQTPNRSGLQLPTSIEHRFQNTGNIHVVPLGVAEVKDPAGRVVERGALNEESGYVLPETFRRFTTPLLSVGHAWLPGRYTVATTYHFEGSDAMQLAAVSFWYAGDVLVWLGMLLVALILAGAGWWLWRARAAKRK